MKVVLDDGRTIVLGETEATPTISIVDYSRRVTDDFGVTTVVERGFARRMAVRLVVPFDQADALQRTLADLRATPAQWVADDRFDWLSFRGFYRDFEVDLALPPVSYCTLTVEGLAETETVADAGVDPAPGEDASTLQVLQPVEIQGAALVSSSVAENDYPEWAAGTAYPLGARVIKAATHRVYESAAVDNIGNDPVGVSGKWIDVGPTNRWAMFDQALGSVTSAAGSISVTLAAGDVNAVALLDVKGGTVRVQTAGYDRTMAPNAAGTVTFLDLPTASNPVTVTVTGNGQVEIGTLLIGKLLGLGSTIEAPKAGITDYSRKEADKFGEVQVVERAWAKRMSVQAMLRADALDVVASRIAGVRATPALWIGKEGMETLTAYGFFKEFSIEVGATVSKLTLSVEGLSTAGKVEPLGSLVNWDDIADPNDTKPEDNATVGAPEGTPVAGKPAEKVVNDLTLNAGSLFSLAKQAGIVNAYMQAKMTLEGKPLGTVVVDVRTVAESSVESLSLIGAKNAAGTAWNLNLDTVHVDEDTSLAQKFTQITGEGFGSEASISQLMKILIDESGVDARAVLSLDVNGHVIGYRATNDGTTGEFIIVADKFGVVDPNDGEPYQVLTLEDGVLTLNGEIRAKSYKLGSVNTDALADYSVSQPDMVVIEGGGASVGTDDDNIWRNFAPLGTPLACTVDVPAGAANATVQFDVHLTGQRTGGDNDRISVRIIRLSDGAALVPAEYTNIFFDKGGNIPVTFLFSDPDPHPGGDTYVVQTKNLEGHPSWQRGVLRPLRLAK